MNTLELPKTGYLAFDALTLKDLLIERLNKEGSFTDQNYVGSHLSAYIDIIAYAYHTLIYYLNQTSSEALFTEAQLYENINKIVKLLDYNPVGYQTSTLSFQASAGTNLPNGTYVIPRYSYVTINSIPFSFTEDITFTFDGTTYLKNFSENHLLYQGQYVETPPILAAGDKNETILVTPSNSNQYIDHFHLDVYVKEENGAWKLYERTPSLYLEPNPSRKCEIRLNAKREYEIRFGDDINGRRLKNGERVVVCYLQSENPSPVGPNTLKPTMPLYKKQTPLFLEILEDTKADSTTQFLLASQAQQLQFSNPFAALEPNTGETVEEIKQKAPSLFRTQYRAVTKNDFLVFIKSNYSRFLQDVSVFDNWDYTNYYLRYFYEKLGADGQGGERALINHALYSDANHYNNVYVLAVPKFTQLGGLRYLTPAQKKLIYSGLEEVKMLTTKICFVDPIFKYITFALQKDTLANSISQTQLIIQKDLKSTKSNDAILLSVAQTIYSFFWNDEVKRLGTSLNLMNLSQQIAQIPGVMGFYLTDGTSISKSLNFVIWNPLYPSLDVSYSSQNVQLQPFEITLLSEADTNALINRMSIE